MTNSLILTAGAADMLASNIDVDISFPFLKPWPTEFLFHGKKDNAPAMLATKGDKVGCRFCVVEIPGFSKFPNDSASDVFRRIARAILASERKTVLMPSSWQTYHVGSFMSFFATQIGHGSKRWITYINNTDGCVFFLQITDSKNQIKLEEYPIPSLPSYRKILDNFVGIHAKESQERTVSSFTERSDLQTIGSAAISKSWNYETWEIRLNTEQQRIRAFPSESSIRIVGPAGSGKTLMLCFKALQGVREDQVAARKTRVAFITHSWAMAERADDALRILNNGVSASEITVLPLLGILQQDILGSSYMRDVSILGDDSTEGRRLQIEMLDSLIRELSSGDIKLLKEQGLSSRINDAIASSEDGVARMELIENIYQEINGLLLAEGIVPGETRKEEEYLTQERADDLPPFLTRGDRAFVLLIYKAFLRRLRDSGYITTEQLVSDATKALETFAWRIKKEALGYDRIFIDELQYFSAQERFAIALLATSPDSAVFVTAEDPSQGVFSAISSNWRGGVPSQVKKSEITMKDVHRFSSDGILEFIKFLYMQFPLNAQSIITEEHLDREHDIPVLHLLHDSDSCLKSVASIVQDKYPSLDSSERLAIICLDPCGEIVAEQLRKIGIPSVVQIKSFDETERLSYSKRSIVVGEWQFLGGTQFSHVIVLHSSSHIPQSSFARIRELTALYVAASRASSSLTIIIGGDAPSEINEAISKKLLEVS